MMKKGWRWTELFITGYHIYKINRTTASSKSLLTTYSKVMDRNLYMISYQ